MKQKQGILFRLLTLQIASIQVLLLNCCPRNPQQHMFSNRQKRPFSPSGGCAHRTADWSGDGDGAPIYRCGLGHAVGLHVGVVMLLRSHIKLLPAWISWWVSKAFARRAAGRAVAEVPWLQHSKRDTNWVSQVIPFCCAFWVTESEEICMLCCFTE